MARILIADDNDVMRTLLKDVLAQPDGWSVCGAAASGPQAVAMAAELKPDLIILDFLMPLLNGVRAAQEILKITPDVPIVLYTLHGSSQLELEATKAGVRKVISKSDGLEALLAGMEELLGGDRPVRKIDEFLAELTSAAAAGSAASAASTAAPPNDPMADPQTKPPGEPEVA